MDNIHMKQHTYVVDTYNLCEIFSFSLVNIYNEINMRLPN